MALITAVSFYEDTTDEIFSHFYNLEDKRLIGNKSGKIDSEYNDDIRYDVSILKGSIMVPDTFNVYGEGIPYTDEMCLSQGMDPANTRQALSILDNQIMIILADEQYKDITFKIYIRVKEKEYGDITLAQLDQENFDFMADGVTQSFGVDEYEMVEGNGLKFFAFENDLTENECRYATIIDGHMVYVFAQTGDKKLTDNQRKILEKIALSIKSDL